MMKSKAGAELSLNTIIVAIILLVVLVVLILLFAGVGGSLFSSIKNYANVVLGLARDLPKP
ncbi:MAG TPA: hypothetical protein VFE88_04370 [Candidatus Nanoarchaeia archaeon]|nr:hypothetical protein [Candidatus Nanoarchaeia archaeon]